MHFWRENSKHFEHWLPKKYCFDVFGAKIQIFTNYKKDAFLARKIQNFFYLLLCYFSRSPNCAMRVHMTRLLPPHKISSAMAKVPPKSSFYLSTIKWAIWQKTSYTWHLYKIKRTKMVSSSFWTWVLPWNLIGRFLDRQFSNYFWLFPIHNF